MSTIRPFLRALMACSLALAVPMVTLAGAPAALAQPTDKAVEARPGADKKQQARQYVDQGLAAQAAGKYDEALDLYRKAYNLVPHPLLLFNMAQANRLAGRAVAAHDLYLRYLDVEPEGVQARTAHEMLVSLQGQIAAEEKAEEAKQAEKARKAAEAKQAGEARRAAEQRRAEEAARRAEQQRAEEQRRRADRDARRGRGSGLRLAGLVSGGAGLLGLGAGVMFHLRARSLSDELSTPGNPYDRDKRSDGESAELLSYVGFAAGGALLAGGATMYFLGRRAASSGERLAIVPALSPGSVGLVVTGGLP